LSQLVTDGPNHSAAWEMLGRVALALGKQPDAAVAFQRAFSLNGSSIVHSRLLQSLQYADDVTPEGLLAAHEQWNSGHAVGVRPIASDRKRAGNGPLRLGFLAGEF